MIRINLLPVRRIQKIQKAKQEVITFLLSVLALLVLIGIVAFGQFMYISSLKAETTNLQNEKNKYQSTINEIEKLKKDKEKLETKLSMIKKLKKGSRVTVRVLDEIATLTPPNRIWLKSMDQKLTVLQLTGVALDNETIAQYMESIKASPVFSDAELNNSSLVLVAGRKLKSFSLTCGVVYSKPEEPEADEKSKK